MTDDPHEAGRDAEIPRYLRRAAPSDRTGLEDRPRARGRPLLPTADDSSRLQLMNPEQ